MPDRQDDLNPASDLAPFADALKRLAPQPTHLSRDALLFEAGKAAAGSRLPPWAWPSIAAAFAALSLVLAAFAVSPSTPRVEYQDRVVYVDRNEPPPPSAGDTLAAPAAVKAPPTFSAEERDKMHMMQVRRDVLRWGVDMLPENKSSTSGPSQDVAARRLTWWLNLPPGTFALPALQPKKPVSKDEENDD